MSIRQLSVFVQNEAGKLQEITDCLNLRKKIDGAETIVIKPNFTAGAYAA